jgi:hypothetical protein
MGRTGQVSYQGWQNCRSDKLDSNFLQEASQQYPITDNRITNCVDTAAVVLLLAVVERMGTCEVTGLMHEWTIEEQSEPVSELAGCLDKSD